MTEGLLTVTARQWKASVTLARRDLARVDAPVVELRYEALVDDPVAALRDVAESLEVRAPA